MTLPFIAEVISSQPIESGRVFWTKEQRKNVEDLCREYGPRSGRRNMSLGFGGAMTLIVFQHKCPNTVPAILWSSNGKSWKSLFPTRPELDYSEPFKRRIRVPQLALKWIGRLRLLDSLLINSLGVRSRKLLNVLSVICRKRFRTPQLSEALEIPIHEIDDIVQRLVDLRWISNNLRPTRLGMYVISRAIRQRVLKKNIDAKTEFYYPTSLRAPDDSTSSLSAEEGPGH
jgi:hypothetical protein